MCATAELHHNQKQVFSVNGNVGVHSVIILQQYARTYPFPLAIYCQEKKDSCFANVFGGHGDAQWIKCFAPQL